MLRTICMRLRAIAIFCKTLSVSPYGICCIACSIVSLIIYWLTGWVEFFAFAIAGFCTFGFAFVTCLAHDNLTCNFSHSIYRTSITTPLSIRITVTNNGTRIYNNIEIRIPRLLEEQLYTVPCIKPKESSEILIQIPTHCRSFYCAGPLTIIRKDPFNLLCRAYSMQQYARIYIHPYTIDTSLQPCTITDSGEYCNGNRTYDGTDFHSLQPYVLQDPIRNIHWRSSLRYGTLITRFFQRPQVESPLIFFNISENCYATVEEFELAVSLLASVGKYVFNATNSLRIVTQTESYVPTTVQDFLDWCSTLTTVSNILPYTASATETSLYITGSQSSSISQAGNSDRFFARTHCCTMLCVSLQDQCSVQKSGQFIRITVASSSDIATVLPAVRWQ